VGQVVPPAACRVQADGHELRDQQAQEDAHGEPSRLRGSPPA
jgi:hypothetical protein